MMLLCRVLLLLVACSPFADPLWAAGHDCPPQCRVEAAEDAYAAAWLRNDADAVEATIADDFTYTNSRGDLQGKQQVVEWMRDPGFRMLEGTLSERKVRLHGDVALLNGRWKSRFEWRGKAGGENIRYSSVWMLRDGRWRIVSEHVTEVVEG